MVYDKYLTTNKGLSIRLKEIDKSRVKEYIDYRRLVASETSNLARYPEEINDVEKTYIRLKNTNDSANSCECGIFVNDKLVGCVGINPINNILKCRHRADFGVAIIKDFCGKGIGRTVIVEMIALSKKLGYDVLELEVVTTNCGAIKLYNDLGFKPFGENPTGFKLKDGSYQSLTMMRLELC